MIFFRYCTMCHDLKPYKMNHDANLISYLIFFQILINVPCGKFYCAMFHEPRKSRMDDVDFINIT